MSLVFRFKGHHLVSYLFSPTLSKTRFLIEVWDQFRKWHLVSYLSRPIKKVVDGSTCLLWGTFILYPHFPKYIVLHKIDKYWSDYWLININFHKTLQILLIKYTILIDTNIAGRADILKIGYQNEKSWEKKSIIDFNQYRF